MYDTTKDTAIILFDGVCNLCNTSVQFIIQHDKNNYFKFASLQSEVGQELLKKYKIDTSIADSIVLIENNRSYVKSTATLRIARHLKALYPLLYGLIIVPPFVRNVIYDFIAKNRYKWFGKQETCMVPSAEITSKFIS